MREVDELFDPSACDCVNVSDNTSQLSDLGCSQNVQLSPDLSPFYNLTYKGEEEK